MPNGSIILCDHIYNDAGKFVIAGTYTRWQTHDVPLRLHQLSVYIRFEPPRFGPLPLRIWVTADGDPGQTPVFHMETVLNVAKENMRLVEVGLRTPGMEIMPEIPALITPNTALELNYSVGYDIDGEFVATTPLCVLFLPPFNLHKKDPNDGPAHSDGD